MEFGEVKAEQRQQPVTPTPMESGEVKAEPRQQPVTPKKRRRPTKPKKSAQANGGSYSSAAAESPLSRTPSSSSPPSGDADGKGQKQQHREQGGGGKKPRLVWTDELHDLFVKAYDSLGDEAVPMKILEKMNEKMNLPELSREKVASHLQKHKINMRSKVKEEQPLGAEASSHSPTEEAPASHLLRSLAPNTSPPLAEVSQAPQLEIVQVLQAPPADCLSRSSSSITANLHIVQSIQQQLCGPPIDEEGQAQPAETMQPSPADLGCSPVEGHGWSLENKSCIGQHMETSTAATLVPEANTEAVIHKAAQAAKAENTAEREAAPAADILGQFWASPDNKASTSSWDIFGLSSGPFNRIARWRC